MSAKKRILLLLAALLLIAAAGGYFYFDRKFTPEDNYLQVTGNADRIPIVWEGEGTAEAPRNALLLPVKLRGIPITCYMQLDMGSPVTLLYATPLQALRRQYRQQMSAIAGTAKLDLQLGTMRIASDRFKIIPYGKLPGASVIIGTIGTDLLEHRVLVMDLRNNYCSFIKNTPGPVAHRPYLPFEFKKRRIMLPAVIDGEALSLLFDSGSSAFWLIVDKKRWEKYRLPGGRINKEKGNSWGRSLSIFTAAADKKIQIGNADLGLSTVTYIEGTSMMQRLLMKASGMQGMIGTQLFIGRVLVIDAQHRRFVVE